MSLRQIRVILKVKMRLIYTIILSAFISLSAFSQENKNLKSTVEPLADAPVVVAEDDDHYLNGMVPMGKIDRDVPQQKDSLHLPQLDNHGRVYDHRSWYYPTFGSWGMWDVHEGLNVQLGLQAFTSFGKGGFSGWGQNISAVYAKTIDDHWSIAVGGYLDNYSTSIGPFRNAGITGVLNYRFNDHWEAYVFGQKSFIDNRNTMFGGYGPYGYGMFGYGMGYGPMYDMGMFGDRIGAGVTWKPTQNTAVQLQVEVQSNPRNNFHNRVQEKWEMPESR